MMNAVMEKTIGRKSKLGKGWLELEEERGRKREQQEFLRLIDQTKEELKNARNNFNFATDALLLEYYIYEIKAAETKLNYYLKKAKTDHVRNPDLAETILFDHEGERGAAL